MKCKKNKKDIIICRCEDISLDEVEKAIDAGITNSEELKRFLHVGMGPCQGRTCSRLVSQLISSKTGKPASTVKRTVQRPPLVTVPVREFVGEDDG